MAKQQILTIPEFMAAYRQKQEIRNIGVEEHIAKRILNDNRLKAMFTFVAGSLMYVQKVSAETVAQVTKAMGKVDTAGLAMLTIVRRIGYWIALLMCIIEIMKALMNGDTKSIGKIIFKYILAFAALFLLPWIFDLIAAIFS